MRIPLLPHHYCPQRSGRIGLKMIELRTAFQENLLQFRNQHSIIRTLIDIKFDSSFECSQLTSLCRKLTFSLMRNLTLSALFAHGGRHDQFFVLPTHPTRPFWPDMDPTLAKIARFRAISRRSLRLERNCQIIKVAKLSLQLSNSGLHKDRCPIRITQATAPITVSCLSRLKIWNRIKFICRTQATAFLKYMRV